MKKRTKYTFGVLCAFTFFLCIGLRSYTQGDEYWTWDDTNDHRGQYIAGDDEYIYSISRRYSTGMNHFLKWDMNGTLQYNVSLPYGALEFVIFEDHLYSCNPLRKWDTNWTAIWNRTWDLYDWDIITDINTDGNYLYASGKVGNGIWNEDMILFQCDMDGNMIWNWTGGSEDRDEEIYATWIQGNDVYAIGDSQNTSTSSYGGVFMKWDTTGVLQYSNIYNDRGSDTDLLDIWGDGTNLFTCGYSGKDPGSHDNYGILIKWAENGDVIWEETWGKAEYEHRCNHIIGDSDFVYTIGERISDKTSNKEIVIRRWDHEGNVIAEKFLSFSERDWVLDVWASNDSLFLTGTSYNWEDEYPYNIEHTEAYILKFPKDFDSDSKFIPGYSTFVILAVLGSGIFVIIRKIHFFPKA
ncbi:MAG: hypothetical protein ACTSRE_16545 [Promethearchaeota archaeon]